MKQFAEKLKRRFFQKQSDEPVGLERMAVEHPKSLKPQDLADHAAVTLKKSRPKGSREAKYRRRFYRPSEGAAWNPLNGYPRNKGCWCGSGAKAKRCCAPLTARCVPVKLAEYLSENWNNLMAGRLTLPAAQRGEK